jgi:predicted solute-binding protein
VLDLGREWTDMTALPMVFAVWAARAGVPPQDPDVFTASLRHGMERIDDIVREEHSKVGISVELARDYLTQNIVFELGEREYAGLATFLQYASELRSPEELKKVTV